MVERGALRVAQVVEDGAGGADGGKIFRSMIDALRPAVPA